MLLPCVLEHICADAPAERQPLGRTFDVRARRRARGGPRARFLSEVSDVPARVVGVVLFDSTAKTKYAGKHGPLLCSQHGARSRDADSLHEEPKKIWTQTRRVAPPRLLGPTVGTAARLEPAVGTGAAGTARVRRHGARRGLRSGTGRERKRKRKRRKRGGKSTQRYHARLTGRGGSGGGTAAGRTKFHPSAAGQKPACENGMPRISAEVMHTTTG
ncbi:unnamed protein product [Prorocentrum cordatum]|uniref:Uncharacterized protein n=1 Tax=Prorocentrum cordatum TaxID=2364126 RepID=A0ABN9YAV6_9DINO|nr:unnamed protein product [Polarella glacialis]